MEVVDAMGPKVFSNYEESKQISLDPAAHNRRVREENSRRTQSANKMAAYKPLGDVNATASAAGSDYDLHYTDELEIE